MKLSPTQVADYKRAIAGLRKEALVLGQRFDEATSSEQVRACENTLADMRVRTRLICDELSIHTDGSEPLDRLVAKIAKVLR